MSIILTVLATGTIAGYIGLIIATIIRKQYLYAIGYVCALLWIIFAMMNVKGLFI